MSSCDELLALQTQLMGQISRALANYKKLGQAKMAQAELDGKLVLYADDKLKASHSYFQNHLFVNCEDVYNEAADFMAEVLATFEPQPPHHSTINVSGLADSFRPSSHLPRINLPTFDGSFDKWESFRDRFTSLVRNDATISNVDRMHYLCSCVKGDASNVLTHLAITEANFVVAWDILQSRYDNKRRLITGHLQTLLQLLALVSETSKDLRNLRNQTNAAIQALQNLGRPVEHWDDVLVFLVAQKLDKFSRKAWELKLGDTGEYPKYTELDQFLESQVRALEAIVPVTPKVAESSKPKNKVLASHAASTATLSCPLCKTSHLLYQCSTFLNQTPAQRADFIRKVKRCFNCLSAKHPVKDCTSSRSCKQCSKRHHTLLHLDASVKNNETEPAESAVTVAAIEKIESEVASHTVSQTVSPNSQILLATARVRVHSSDGRAITIRALLDQGSAATLITESIAQCLRLPKISRSVCVTGIGDTKSIIRHAVTITLTPTSCDGPAYSTTALIMKSLTRYKPSRVNSMCSWKHITGLKLADSEPMNLDPVDLIIGANLFGFLLLEGVRKGAENEPIAQNTTLGWILSGPVASPPSSPRESVQIHHGTVFDDLESDLRRFWEVEDIPRKAHMSPEELQCEEHFATTHTRTPEGRYVVRLPFKRGLPQLGESRFAALSSLRRVEHRLEREPTTASEYREFLDEYERLGHMAKIPPEDLVVDVTKRYYIPHHAVVRATSKTTRLRVVFNASARTTNGTSLNDHLLIGPKLQRDLVVVILRWRQYRYVFTADIAKMYRQIRVDPCDTDYQRILWRRSPSDPVEEYRMLTVTYGGAYAPFAAIRSVEQLAADEGSQFSLAVPVLLEETYVDDCVFGADDKVLARQTRDQVNALLAKGCFRLRKWASNCPELIADLDPSDHGLASPKVLQNDEHLKILGIAWNPPQDVFQFQVATQNPGTTKRAILSTIAKLFDPLGWVAPVVVTAKIFMQQLWLLKINWDDEIPDTHLRPWVSYHSKLPCVNQVQIPRWTKQGADTLHLALHGFSDASTKAYAAAVYLRTVHVDGSVTVSLLIAKSKVAPLKIITVPRLELLAAHLLAGLMHFVRTTLQIPLGDCHCWIDADIVRAWLSKSPSHWKTFVANRVAAIQTALPEVVWRHVHTHDNPADCASRGLAPDEIQLHPLGWTGPSWLKESPEFWPVRDHPAAHDATDGIPEARPQPVVCVLSPSEPWDLASRFSSWPKLLRVTAYMLRFVRRARIRNQSREAEAARDLRPPLLRTDDIQDAKRYWLRSMQNDTFRDEIASLRNKTALPKASPLRSLHPHIDSDGLLRVGGRLQKSNLPETMKHPIVLRSHPLLTLIIEHHHLRTMHGGSQLTLASLRTEFWILRARATVRFVLHKCVRCAREAAKVSNELMGELPEMRVNRVSRAFLHTGVDYAGPIAIRTAPGRGQKSHKAYIALFICLTTKAIHLELVSDVLRYTAATFTAAYHRFVSRRGLPQHMYSDNGTTFHGADRQLSDAYYKAVREPNFLNRSASEKTTWHFLPPAAPHFGGLWEAGVKSVKYHLKRCIGSHTLTYEEMTTILCRIEACLNSRPLAAISEHLDDYQALTPGHFLVGASLVASPEPSVLDINENRLSRWQLAQQITEGFWKSWSHDYLHTLQQRPKWRAVQRLARLGQIVLIRNPLAPPSQWELGRITVCHPGEDGLTRVVTVRTSRSEYKRPITKLCFLPVDINNEQPIDSAMAGGATH